MINKLALSDQERAFLLALDEEIRADQFVYGPAHQVLFERGGKGMEFRNDICRMITAADLWCRLDPARSYEWPWATEEELNQRIKESRIALGLD